MSRNTTSEPREWELRELRARLEEAEETLQALRNGEVDAVVIGEQVYMLESAEAASNRLRGDALALVHDAVIVVDTNDYVTYLNPAAELQYGVTAATTLGRSVTEVFQTCWLHPNDEAAFAALVEKGHWRGETMHIKRDGTTLYVESSVTVLHDQHGVVTGRLAIIRDITERKQAETELIESENRLHRAIAESPFPIIIHDEDDRILEVSKGWTNYSGYTLADIPTITDWTTRAYGERQAFAKEYIDRLFAANETVPNGEWEINAKDGTRHIWDFFATPLGKTPSGQRLLLSMAADVTERKQTEERLRRNHETFFRLVQNAPFGIYIVDSAFRLIQISAGSQKVFSNIHPLIGRDFAEILHTIWSEPFATEAIEHFRHTLATGEPYRAANTTEQRNDTEDVESYDWKIERILLPDGQFGVVCYFYDLTELRQAQEKLRAREQRLTISTDAAALGIFEWQIPNDVALWENERVYQIFGFAPGDDALSQQEFFEHYLHYEDADALEAQLTEAMQTGVLRQAIVRIRRKDGALRWIELNGQIEYAADGSPLRLIGVTADITERKESELERERLLAQEQKARATAEAATRAKDEFLAVVSHELRNPLNAILGYTRMARAQAHDAAAVVRHCDIVERNARMQQQLIEDLLDTARIISGKLKIEAAPADLRLILEEALSVVLPAALAKQIQVLSYLPDEPQPIIGDAARLQQVAWNLLQNAIKFTPNGGQVELRLRREHEQVQIIVSDSGQGIEPEFLDAIFDRFSQRDMARTRRHGGLGLGLALVKDLVELHGGTITVISAGAGQGATFTLTLPLRAPQQMLRYDAPQRAIAEVRTGPDAIPLEDLPHLDGVRVLVVDDQEEAREMVATTLGEWGAIVTTAASGPEARTWLRQQPCDVLVCDIAMPDEDGYAVIQHIRAFEQENGIPFANRLPAIALTALARPEDRRQALSAGFQMHVAKPVELAELIVVINSLTYNGQVARA